MLVGLTGQIGAGKSTAAAILKSFGAVIVDADLIGRRVVEESTELRSKLAEVFGAEIIAEDGTLDRAQVALRAFADEDSRLKLNDIVHPILLRELRQQVEDLRQSHEVVVIDAALLLEWELDRECDEVVVITAPEDARMERLAPRGIIRSDALARQNRQLSEDEFAARATHVVCNDRGETELKAALERIWSGWTAGKGKQTGE